MFNCLTGFYRATGVVSCCGRGKVTDVIQVLGQKLHPDDFLRPAQLGRRIYYKMFGGTHLVNRAGMARTFQNIRLFREMSVIENLLVAQHTQVNRHLLAGIPNTLGYRQAENQALDRRFYWLEVVEMVDCANPSGGGTLLRTAAAAGDRRAMCTPSGDDLSGRAGRRPQPGGNPGAEPDYSLSAPAARHYGANGSSMIWGW